MPIMDGIEAGKKILDHYKHRGVMLNDNERKSDFGNQDLPTGSKPLLFGLSAFVNYELVQKLKTIGFVDCIQAPLTSDGAANILNCFVEDQLREEMEL